MPEIVTANPLTGKPFKVMVVGDSCTGKTPMIITHTTGVFPTEYVPTVIDNIKHDQTVDEITYRLTLWDTTGQEDYERLRQMSYPSTSVFIVCFSLDSRASFDNIARKWLPELRANNPKVPVLLVGTKMDIRDDSQVTWKEAQQLCKKEGLVEYLECSAKTKEGLNEVFNVAVKVAAGLIKKKSQKCCIM